MKGNDLNVINCGGGRGGVGLMRGGGKNRGEVIGSVRE